MPTDRVQPFSVAWTSHRLYRTVADLGDFGQQQVALDGWDDALAAAWQEMFDRPDVGVWIAGYDRARGEEHLVVQFGDYRRVSARHGAGYLGVSYPADLLLTAEDRATAMRVATVVAFDKHVAKSGLDVPPLSSVVD